MSSASKANQPPKGSLAMPGFAPFHPSNASLLLEKTKPGIRRSTPDSEALASSDDELDLQSQNRNMANTSMPKPGRRPSWMNDIPSGTQQRKASLPSSSSFSPVSSHPTTPSTDQAAWGSTTSPALGAGIGWNHGPNPSFPWSTGIWNPDGRGKEPPSRLTEVLASPTTMVSSASGNNGHLEDQTRTQMRDQTRVSGDSSIPFAIPLHPTPKTYRSQSYSVGQLDPELINLASGGNPSNLPYSQGRTMAAGKYPGLQHRPSRPSVFGEHPHESLGQVREDEDDSSANGSEDTSAWTQNTASLTSEPLTMDNLALRQVVSNPAETSRFRERAASSSAGSTFGLGNSYRMAGTHRIQGSVPEESDLAVEDFDTSADNQALNDYRSNAARRYSEAQANYESQYSIPLSYENRALENVKKAHWQTSLGFPGVIDTPQSRRHSFADIPARHGSIASTDTTLISPGVSNIPGIPNGREDLYAGYGTQNQMVSPSADPQSYFAIPPSRRMAEAPSSGVGSTMQQHFNPYGRHFQGQANQLLFIVTFKCCRADVFYVQEDTGLQVQPGDLVIVEADRGTDLGTVAHANVSWSKAREYKDHYAEEHYKWLMLFSQQSRTGAPNAVNPNGMPGMGGAPGSAIGGMGPPGQHGAQEAQSAELKPKLIKRLAQNHEIQSLREKEGNEAKAKRVCQQKVLDHRLNMEILDAEFQMDWKKLTFYYFADTYINFNSLVTDLFKIYKTRIWMSAINPASFVTPTAGLQPPTVVGPGAMGFGSEPSASRRQQERDGVPRAMYMDPYQAFAQPPRQTGLGLSTYATSISPQADPFSSYSPATGGFPYLSIDPNTQNYMTSGSNGNHGPRRNNGEIASTFQGLSLT